MHISLKIPKTALQDEHITIFSNLLPHEKITDPIVIKNKSEPSTLELKNGYYELNTTFNNPKFGCKNWVQVNWKEHIIERIDKQYK